MDHFARRSQDARTGADIKWKSVSSEIATGKQRRHEVGSTIHIMRSLVTADRD